jgi:hypothetical protein
MSDPTPHDIDAATPIEPAPAAAPTPAAPTPAAPAPAVAKAPWYGRRVPLLISGAALILGCLLGGGIVAIAAFAVGGDHGDDRGSHNSRDERADGRDNGNTGRHMQNRGGNDQPTPAPSTSSSTARATSVPAPSASA